MFGLLGIWSCQEWNQEDPEAANQVYPKIVKKGSYSFGKAFSNDVTLGAYEGGEEPLIVIDDSLGYVTQLTGGYLKITNPLLDASLQTGYSVTMWVKVSESNSDEAAIFSFSNESDSTISFTPAGTLAYNMSEAALSEDLLLDNEWQYLAVLVDTGGYTVYVNGEEKISERGGNMDYEDIVGSVTAIPSFYLGYGTDTSPNTMWVDNINVYRNLIEEDAIATPEVENDAKNALPTPVYSIDFESGLTFETIAGTGSLVDDDSEYFGKVYYNVGPDGAQAQRTNYLILPSDIFSNITSAGTNEMTISFWVNVASATDYYFTPLFSAYGAAPIDNVNTWPMLVLETRGWMQVNCSGYCDFGDTYKDNSEYTNSTDWLVDGEWHLYTSVWTETNVKVYIDAVETQSWTVDGVSGGQVVSGPMLSGSQLTYICLGGNQAWSWGDVDGAFKFDDVAIFSKALSKGQIEGIMTDKYISTTSAN